MSEPSAGSSDRRCYESEMYELVAREFIDVIIMFVMEKIHKMNAKRTKKF